MKTPTLTVIVPSIGYPILINTIQSIKAQELVPGDQIIVVADGQIDSTEALVLEAGPPFEYRTYGPTRTWGNCQRNFGLLFARGDYLVWMDEDDIFQPDAFQAIRQRAVENPGAPLMFKMQGPEGGFLWQAKEVRCCAVGGHMFVTPNVPGRVGRWGTRYEADYDFIRSTVDLYPNKDADVVWCPEWIANLRPHVKSRKMWWEEE